MSTRAIAEISRLNDVTLRNGMGASSREALERSCGIVLPAAHTALLEYSNGIEAYAGYVRLFGVGGEGGIDSIAWNHHDCWKFAWGGRASGFWCFAETAWGDQCAYALDVLTGGKECVVYFLDAFSMTPQVVASSFAEFLEGEFLRCGKEPYDPLIRQARQKFGPLDVATHLVYVPSLLLGGTEEIAHVEKMDARAAMICNGDIAIQLDEGPPEKSVESLQLYQDEMQRTRLRLLWK